MSTRMFAVVAVAAMICIYIFEGCPQQERSPAVSESGNIIIQQPGQGDIISSPVTVTGQARVFEAALSIRVRGSDERELGITHTTATAGGPEFGDYRAEVDFEIPSGMTQGWVEAFSISAKTGEEIDVVRVPVRFR